MMVNDNFSFYKKGFKNKQKDVKKDGFKRFLYVVLIKSLIVIILFLASLIFIKQSTTNKENFKKVVYNNSLSFAKIYALYKNYLGDLLPFKDSKEDNTKVVLNEKINYTNIEKEGDGYLLDVSSSCAVSAINGGIVIEKKEDDKYQNLIKVQDENGLNVTYGNLYATSVSLYEYVEKGQLLGNAKDELYLVFEEDGNYLSYEGFI